MVDSHIVDEFRNNEPYSEMEGGDRRPSKLVDLQNFNSIRRRQALNSVLLRRACGNESEEGIHTFNQEDRDILVQMALERDPNGNVAIRKHAVNALGQYRELKVAESLLHISTSDIEDETIRSHALVSLAHVSPKMTRSILSHYITDRSPLVRQTLVNIISEIGDESALDLLGKISQKERDRAVIQRAFNAVQSVEKRLGITIPSRIKRRLKPDKIPSKTKNPKSEDKVKKIL